MNRAVSLPIDLAVASLTVSLRADDGSPSVNPTYERHIRPILKAHCFECHGEGDELAGNLDLRLRRFIVRGGDSGAALVEGDRDSSYLYQRVQDGDMPPGK